MNNETNKPVTNPDLLFIGVVTRGKGSQMMNLLRRRGASYAICTFAEGTVPGHVLRMLGMAKTKKELVLALISQDIEDSCYEGLAFELKLDHPGHGVAFSVPLCNHPEPSENNPLAASLIIVDKGKGEDVLDLFEQLGLRGGTMLSAYGGATIAKILFDMPVQPEKELVFVVAPEMKIKEMFAALGPTLKLDQPNQGVAASFPITRSLGLYSAEQKGN